MAYRSFVCIQRSLPNVIYHNNVVLKCVRVVVHRWFRMNGEEYYGMYIYVSDNEKYSYPLLLHLQIDSGGTKPPCQFFNAIVDKITQTIASEQDNSNSEFLENWAKANDYQDNLMVLRVVKNILQKHLTSKCMLREFGV